jgi:hypothetical protein
VHYRPILAAGPTQLTRPYSRFPTADGWAHLFVTNSGNCVVTNSGNCGILAPLTGVELPFGANTHARRPAAACLLPLAAGGDRAAGQGDPTPACRRRPAADMATEHEVPPWRPEQPGDAADNSCVALTCDPPRQATRWLGSRLPYASTRGRGRAGLCVSGCGRSAAADFN